METLKSGIQNGICPLLANKTKQKPEIPPKMSSLTALTEHRIFCGCEGVGKCARGGEAFPQGTWSA